MSEFWKRLEALMREKNLKKTDVAKLAGVTNATVTGWKNGAIPVLDTLKKLAENIGVSVYWLLNGEERRASDGANKGSIPVGVFIINEQDIDFKEINKNEFCAAASVFKECKSFVMDGNHLEPSIKNGDIIVIDTADKTIKNGSIYAFFVESQFIVAMLSRSITGHLTASYTNPPQSEKIDGKITIIGRAVQRLTAI